MRPVFYNPKFLKRYIPAWRKVYSFVSPKVEEYVQLNESRISYLKSKDPERYKEKISSALRNIAHAQSLKRGLKSRKASINL